VARTKIYVPRETAAVSVGADEVALAIAQVAKKSSTDIELIRNGSWGASWLEPLVEVEVDGVRIAYGNVTADDVAGIFESGLITGGEHARRLGPINEIPYLINQDRWTFWRCGLVNPLSIEDFECHQGFKALEKAFVYAAGAALVSRRASSGAPLPMHRVSKNTSRVMPMKATAAHSRIASSWKVTPSGSSRAWRLPVSPSVPAKAISTCARNIR
jgi:hypothetical protein